uniref:Uncharacterized protein n=1 Tax=Globodera pallida TaxID=36090 RepID=A0A183CN89_GLOPA
MRFLREDFSIASIFGLVDNCNDPSGRIIDTNDHPAAGLSVKQQQPEERQVDGEASTSTSAQQDLNSGGEGTSSSTARHVGKRELKK